MEGDEVDRVNLIPAPRREAKACRAHVRTLAGVLTVYTVLMLGFYATCYALSDSDTEATFHEMREIADSAKQSNTESRLLRGTIAEARQELAAAHAVARHPDWSLLLAVLADTVTDHVVLDRCVLSPVDVEEADTFEDNEDPSGVSEEDKARRALAARLKRGYRLELSGRAKTQAAVSKFVLRLEKVRLFDSVKMIKTSRQSSGDSQAVAFEIECSLSARKGPTGR